jgi:hypothetical protein
MQLHLLGSNKSPLDSGQSCFGFGIFLSSVFRRLEYAKLCRFASCVLSRAQASAFFACPAIGHKHCVFGVERMTALAMCLSSIAGCCRIAAQQIFAAGYRLKMSWIKTWPIAAQVVQLHPFGNRTTRKLVHDPVRQLVLAVNPDSRIAFGWLAKRPAFIRLANMTKQSKQAMVFSHPLT